MAQSYTPEELIEFQTLIGQKLKKAQDEYDLLFNHVHKKDNSARDTNWSANMMEDGREALSQEEANIILQKQDKFINALKGALVRIANKTYGICAVTGALIPKGRLLAVPHTTTCIGVKNTN